MPGQAGGTALPAITSSATSVAVSTKPEQHPDRIHLLAW